MNFFRSHFSYNKQQRNGILYLVILIVLLQSIYVFLDFSSDEKIEMNNDEIALFKKEFDSLYLAKLNSEKPKIFPFNPNYLSDFKAYQLGLNTSEIDKLLEFRLEGKFVNSSAEFQNVTKISDSLLQIIEPFFKFPSRNFENKLVIKNEVLEPKVLKDINKATSEELQKVFGIGEKLSERIIKYRNSLKGFYFNDQLLEVYGLKSELVERIFEYFEIKEKPVITKLNINSASFKEILALPYIDYELTKRIFNYKNEVVEIQSIEELKKIEGFPLEKFNRIALYLVAN
jgi:competence ComEA-like helix-hairpin-helix protein